MLLQSRAAPCNDLVDVLAQHVALFDREIFVDATGNGTRRVDLAPTGRPNDFLAVFANEDCPFSDLWKTAQYREDVAFLGWRIEAEQEVRRCQMEDVQGVRLQDLAVMHEPSYLVGGGRDLVDSDHGVHGLRRRKMMAHRADAAEPLNNNRDLPEHAAADEPFEPAELDDVEARFIHHAGLVQANGDLAVAFDAGDRIDHDLAQSRACLNAVHDAPPRLARSTARSVIRT